MRDKANRLDRRIRNGSSYFGSGVRRKCPTKENLGTDGKTCTVVVSNSVKDVKSAEDHPHGVAARGDYRY